jgi:hypothetical protein
MGNSITPGCVIISWDDKNGIEFDWTKLTDEFKSNPGFLSAWLIRCLSVLPPFIEKWHQFDLKYDVGVQLTHDKSKVNADDGSFEIPSQDSNWVEVINEWNGQAYKIWMPCKNLYYTLTLDQVRDLSTKYIIYRNNYIEMELKEKIPDHIIASLTNQIITSVKQSLSSYKSARAFRTAFRMGLDNSMRLLNFWHDQSSILSLSEKDMKELETLQKQYHEATKTKTMKVFTNISSLTEKKHLIRFPNNDNQTVQVDKDVFKRFEDLLLECADKEEEKREENPPSKKRKIKENESENPDHFIDNIFIQDHATFSIV